jgi:hypothetical protein
LTDLPTPSRSIDGLMILAPGVTGFGNVSNISNPQISGSHYWGSTNFSLNGVSLNNFGNGSASGTQSFNENQIGEANLPPPDALQEFRVDSGGLSAEYRNVAAVTLVLKQGSNSYHGSAYEYLEDKVLNANYFMLNAVECDFRAAVRATLDGQGDICRLEDDSRIVLRIRHQQTECATAECAAAATGDLPAVESGAVHVHGRPRELQPAPTGIAQALQQ